MFANPNNSNNSNDIGYIESYMNSRIFQPIDRTTTHKPKYIKRLKCNEHDECDNEITISYFILHPNTEKTEHTPYILWSHGNGSDLMDSYLSMIDIFRNLNEMIGIIMYDYEGYSYSSGQCREN